MNDLTPEPDFSDQVMQQLRDMGNVVVEPADWTASHGLAVLRENRRRYAGVPRARLYQDIGERLVSELSAHTGANLETVRTTLLFTSAWLGGVAFGLSLSPVDIVNVLGSAALTADDQVQADGEAP
jgi:hypothetical protein